MPARCPACHAHQPRGQQGSRSGLLTASQATRTEAMSRCAAAAHSEGGVQQVLLSVAPHHRFAGCQHALEPRQLSSRRLHHEQACGEASGRGHGRGQCGINRESRANPTPVHVHVRAGCTVQPRPPVPPPLLARWFPPASSQHASSPLHLPLPALKYCGRSQQNSGQASRSASVCRPAVQSGAARTWCGGGSGGCCERRLSHYHALLLRPP